MTPRSIKPEHPLDPVTIDILRAVADEAQADGVDYMLVGATARDILLTHVLGLAPTRATRDVDFAVAVQNWDQFATLRKRLVSRGTFKDAGGLQQRLFYAGENGDPAYQLDAHDLAHLMANYTAAGNLDRVYDEEGVIEAGDYDPDMAGVYLLGLDIRRVASDSTCEVLNRIIARDFDRLATDMTRSERHRDGAEEWVLSRLRLLQRALA